MPPIQPPVAPMLARLARQLPTGDRWVFEPKWDGFRCVAFVADDEVELWSRNNRPLGRYFPELVADFAAIGARAGGGVVDGEILIRSGDRFDFGAVMMRIHPAASRVARLAAETPAMFVSFDALAVGDDDLRPSAFSARRSRLEEFVGAAGGRVSVTPATGDRDVAERWLDAPPGSGIDGVVAKSLDQPYREGERAMVKVKRERTADCVVAGFRWLADRPQVGSLLLGLYDDAGELRHVGVAASFTDSRRAELVEELRPYAADLAGHPWEHGFALERGPIGRLRGAGGQWRPDMGLDWQPLEPVLVCEVAYDRLEGPRFRHPARFVRWRPDRDARSCRFDQIAADAVVDGTGSAAINLG